MPTVSASSNPELASQIIQSAMADLADQDSQPVTPTEVIEPPNTVFTLPGGFQSLDGSVLTQIEVRELTGRDEEAVSKSRTVSSMSEQILKRGLVRVGELPVDASVLDNMLSGDRDFALLKIFQATFGETVSFTMTCNNCVNEVDIEVDVEKDVPIESLDRPGDAYFEVKCSKGMAKVMLPTGVTQRTIQDAANKTYSELSTILLANTVLQVGNRKVLTEQDVLDLPIRDRRTISEELAKRTPGPRLRDVTKNCPQCDAVLEVPLTLSSLFQF